MYIFFQPQATDEQKTKPTQASVRELRGLGFVLSTPSHELDLNSQL
jgi:CTP synthase (UTP-ammonia lyase)